jgi:hypothetical protein
MQIIINLRRRSTAARLLRLWVRIPPGAWMFVCCVLSVRGLCNELVTRPEESYQKWCVVTCDQETSCYEEAIARTGLQSQRNNHQYNQSVHTRKVHHLIKSDTQNVTITWLFTWTPYNSQNPSKMKTSHGAVQVVNFRQTVEWSLTARVGVSLVHVTTETSINYAQK